MTHEDVCNEMRLAATSRRIETFLVDHSLQSSVGIL